jgi:anaerobic dimethyl sulfoxide reductase subunit B
MSKQLAFHVDLNDCTGCKACQVACKDKWDLEVGTSWRRVVEYAGGAWLKRGETYQQDVFTYYISLSCNHCAKPICEEICPTQAIYKRSEDGVVLIEDRKCIGCRYCEWACPYGGLQFDASQGKMTKCNFCFDELAQGRPPACVASCPSRALDFGSLEELRQRYGNDITSEIEPLPREYFTAPALVLTPHRHAQVTGTGTGRLSNPEEI